MACRQDPYPPDVEEAKSVGELIEIFCKKTGQEVPVMAKLAKRYSAERGDNNTLTADLCGRIAKLSKRQLEQVVYDAHSADSRKLADWWEEHQKEDAASVKKTIKAIKDEKDRNAAIKKLSVRERKLLNLK